MDDCALQYYVLSNLGYSVDRVNLIYINKNYIREDELNLDELFIVDDITQQVASKQRQVEQNLIDFEQILALEEEPNIDIGKQCHHPYKCDAYTYCWDKQRNLCHHENIFNIARLDQDKKFSLYKQNIINFSDIKDLSIFNVQQQIQIKACLNQEIIINKDKIKAFFSDVKLSYVSFGL
ncbi:hypothetical protein [Campylobacter estrildidarum]|uniref:hypothetical protein n=1 Tax=Campylobacter estrildidarum TaxID=2510189 RepID=UPI00319DC31A